MTAHQDRDARIDAFFETGQPDLPDRAFHAIRRDIHRTRQLLVLGPFREPTLLPRARYPIAAAVVLASGIVLLSLRPVAGPGGSPAPTPTVAPSAFVSPSVAASPSGPTTFISPQYGYSLRLPVGWISSPALVRWDGVREPGPDVESDKFVGPDRISGWAYAGSFSGDLAAFQADRMNATARDHADTCPEGAFEPGDEVEIRGQPWRILAGNCGALLYEAITLREGVAYVVTFRDLGLHAAADPADRALFLSILDTVQLP